MGALWSISPNYVSDQTIFAGTVVGVFKSTNGAASWSYTGPGKLIVNALAISPGYDSDHTIFAGIQNGGVYKTTNGEYILDIQWACYLGSRKS